MNTVPEHIDDKIYSYLDGKLEGADKESFEYLLAHDEAVKTRFHSIAFAEKLMTESQLSDPPLDFTHRIMERLNNPPQTMRLPIRNGLMLFLAIIVIVGILAGLISTGFFNQTTMIDVSKIVPLEEVSQKEIPSLAIDLKWMIRIIIVLNIAVAFIVLDRTVLKPLFHQRHQQTV